MMETDPTPVQRCTDRECGNRPAPGKRCEKCRAKAKDRAAVCRARRKDRGTCSYDGKPLEGSHLTCQACLASIRERNRARRAANVETGLCLKCKAETGINERTGLPYTRCLKCRTAFNVAYNSTRMFRYEDIA